MIVCLSSLEKDLVNLKIIFFGTPKFAAGVLNSLINNNFNIAAVFTQPDKKLGRRQEIVFSPVKKLAIENGIKVFQPTNLKDIKVIREIKAVGADLFVVAAYGKILPKEIIEIPKYGAINVHASLLPKYRGASPVQCAILAGEKETGITLMLMNEKMDEGDILIQEEIKIGENETVEKLMERLEGLAARMIVKFIPNWIKGKIKPVPQNHKKATYCKPILRQDGKIDWNSDADEIYRKWRAYHPWPGIYAFYKTKNSFKRLKLIKIGVLPNIETGEKRGKIIKYNHNIAVQAKNGLIILKKIHLEGKKETEVDEFLRGDASFIGSSLK